VPAGVSVAGFGGPVDVPVATTSFRWARHVHRAEGVVVTVDCGYQ
jgi:hypothetical protein